MPHSIENTAENFKSQNKAQSSSDANTAQLGVNRQVYASESQSTANFKQTQNVRRDEALSPMTLNTQNTMMRLSTIPKDQGQDTTVKIVNY